MSRFGICLTLIACLAGDALALDHAKPFGEPNTIAGKRIVFTTWYWVRQGQTQWLNAEGKSVFADKKEMAGPLDAHFDNIDGPWGVRLIADQARRGGKLAVAPENPWEAGGINIEAADLDGKTIPGHSFADANPIVGDQYRTLLTWKNSDTLGVATGKPVVPRFRMEKAKIYGLDFE